MLWTLNFRENVTRMKCAHNHHNSAPATPSSLLWGEGLSCRSERWRDWPWGAQPESGQVVLLRTDVQRAGALSTQGRPGAAGVTRFSK